MRLQIFFLLMITGLLTEQCMYRFKVADPLELIGQGFVAPEKA
jgi:hypothetical protein